MKIINFKIIILSLTCSSLIGCAGSLKHQTYEDQVLNDPFEGFNRASYSLTNSVDKVVLKPISKAYVTVVPNPARKGVSNFFNNLGEPLSAVNSLLQLKLDDSVKSLTRLVVNSTFGIVGLVDVSTKLGLESNDEDFGQTLAFWGVKPGPYVMVPLSGPTTVRDFLGGIPDALLNPINISNSKNTNIGLSTLSIINSRSQILKYESMLEDQVDPYSFIRSGYEQNRMGQIFDGSAPEPEEDF